MRQIWIYGGHRNLIDDDDEIITNACSDYSMQTKPTAVQTSIAYVEQSCNIEGIYGGPPVES